MPLPVLPIAIAAGASIISGALSYKGGQDAAKAQDRANKQAAAQQKEMMDYIKSLGYPEADAIQAAQEAYPIDWSIYDTAALDKIKVGDTSLKDVVESPEFKAQEGAMKQYGEIAAEKGMDAQARAAFEQADMEAAQTARAQQEALKQTMARRGLAGSGMELAQAQMAGQGASDISRMAGVQQASSAQQRALQALSNQTNLAQQMVGTRKDIGSAQDAMNLFNTGELLKTQRRLQDAKLEEEIQRRKVLQNQPIEAANYKLGTVGARQNATSNIASNIQQGGQIAANKEAGGYEAASKTIGTLGQLGATYAGSKPTTSTSLMTPEQEAYLRSIGR